MATMRTDCPMRHENGNCLPCGGFCTAVNNEICAALHNAYQHGCTNTAMVMRDHCKEPVRNADICSVELTPEQLLAYLDSFIDSKITQGASLNTCKSYRQNIQLYIAYLQENDIPHSAASIMSYIACLKQTVKLRTVNCKVSAFNQFFSYLCQQGVAITRSLAYSGVSDRPKFSPEHLSLEEIKKIHMCIRTEISLAKDSGQPALLHAYREAAILLLLLSTGISPSELCALKPEHVDLSQGIIFVFMDASKSRKLQIGKDDLPLFYAYAYHHLQQMQCCGRFFLNSIGDNLTCDSLRRIVRKYAAKAGIKKQVTPMMLRTSFIVHSLENGSDLMSLNSILGHASVDSTERYRQFLKKRTQKDGQ